jgi:hypothetical protein
LAYFRHFTPFLYVNYTIFSRQKHKKSRQIPVFCIRGFCVPPALYKN